MKKNLVYYCLGLKPIYTEIFKTSLRSLDYSNPNLIDVLVITYKEYYEKHLSSINRKNLFFHFVEEFKSGDDACFSKLKIFEWERVNDYENLFQSDCDVLFNINMNYIFEKCKSPKKIYAPVEDYRYENHKRIYFSLGNYTEEDIEYFRNNQIHTFNCGTYMIKNSIEMKKNFQNISNMIKSHEGEYFSDQSFMNYYFNRIKLADYNGLEFGKNLIYVVEENVDTLTEFSNKIFHFLGNTYYGEDKVIKMRKIFDKISKDKRITITKISEDRKVIYFTSSENIEVFLNVKVGKQILYEEKMILSKDINYWVSVNDGINNKTVEFFNNDFFESHEIRGIIEDINEKVKKVRILKNEENKITLPENRGEYFNFYNQTFDVLRYSNLSILETNSKESTRKFFTERFPNSKIVSTTPSISELENSEFCELYFFDNMTKKLLDPITKLNGTKSFDLIVLSKALIVNDIEFLKTLLNLIKRGGRLYIEEFTPKDFVNLKLDDLKIDGDLSYEIMCLMDESNNPKYLFEILRTF